MNESCVSFAQDRAPESKTKVVKSSPKIPFRYDDDDEVVVVVVDEEESEDPCEAYSSITETISSASDKSILMPEGRVKRARRIAAGVVGVSVAVDAVKPFDDKKALNIAASEEREETSDFSNLASASSVRRFSKKSRA
jgi:hypothetical protein